MPTLKTILFATDYSESAIQAMNYAASLARDLSAKLLIVHVSELERYPVGELFDEEPQPSDEDMEKLKAMAPPDHRIVCEYRTVCRERGLNPRHIADDLAEKTRPAYRESGTDWYQMSMTELCDHIESTHHNYLRRELPRLGTLISEAGKDRQDQYPSLEELTTVVADFQRQLMDHVEVEETELFSALRALDTGELPVGSEAVDHYDLVDRMRDEHERIGVGLLHIRRLTNGYVPPQGASETYRAMIGGLWELEANLQLAMREEDEILFAKARMR